MLDENVARRAFLIQDGRGLAHLAQHFGIDGDAPDVHALAEPADDLSRDLLRLLIARQPFHQHALVELLCIEEHESELLLLVRQDVRRGDGGLDGFGDVLCIVDEHGSLCPGRTVLMEDHRAERHADAEQAAADDDGLQSLRCPVSEHGYLFLSFKQWDRVQVRVPVHSV